MKKLKFFMVLMTLVPMLGVGQYKFEQTLQITNSDDYIVSTDIVSGTSDYISAGYTYKNSAYTGQDILIFKWDDQGYGVNSMFRYTGPGNRSDCAKKIMKTSNGYLVVGNTSSFKSGTRQNDAFVMKLNSNLTTISAFKVFGTTYQDYAFSCCEDDDNYYVCGRFGASGKTLGFACSFDKTTGNSNWARYYTDANNTMAFYSIIVGYDGELYIAGINSVYQMFAIKLNHTDGSRAWAYRYNPSNYNGAAWNITKATNNGYLLTGYGYSTSGNTDTQNDIYLIKIRSDGSVVWAKSYDGNKTHTVDLNTMDNGLQSIMNSDASGYTVFGCTRSFKSDDLLLMSIDTAGIPSWARTYHNRGSNEGTPLFHNLSDGMVYLGSDGFAITSGQEVSTGINDPYLIRTDASGHTGCDSTRTFNYDPKTITLTEILPVINEIYNINDTILTAWDISKTDNILCDTTNLFDYKKSEIINNNSSINETVSQTILNIFPNPSSGLVHFTIKNMIYNEANIFIYDFMGKLVYFDKIDKFKLMDYSVDLSKYGKGLFLVKIVDGSQTTSSKFVIQ